MTAAAATVETEAPPSPPEVVEPAEVGGVHVLGGTVLESGDDASDPPVDPAALKEAGIDGNVVSVEEDQQGAVFYIYDDGSWVFILPDEVSDEAGDIVQPLWSAGNFCAGAFAQISKINNQLYWGGQNYCSGTSNVYPHSLTIMLRDGCTGFLCWQEEAGTRTSTDSRYNLVQTVSIFTNCANSTQRRYDQVAWPVVQGVQFGPIVDTENFIVNCDWYGVI